LKKMTAEERVALSPSEARSIVRYLAASHGLAPEEARSVMYYPEHRIHDENEIADRALVETCTKCHAAARPLSWRRSLEDWKQLAERHVARYKMKPNSEAIAALGRLAPLHTPEWDAWSSRSVALNLTGRWLVSARLPGHGRYIGEMNVKPGAAPDEFTSHATLRSIADGSVLERVGQGLVFAGDAWRGRSRGINPSGTPDDPSNEAREAMWISPDQARMEGRWFWGQYQEFGFDVTLRRPSSEPALLAIDRSSLKTGSQGNRVRLIGDNFPAQVTPADLNFGPDIAVRRAIFQNSGEIVADVDVAADAKPHRTDVVFRGSVLPRALAIYDQIDYLRVTPESSLAAFGSPKYARGFQQFEAIAYQRGADGKPHTSDDLELGPVDAAWSIEIFYSVDTSRDDAVGTGASGGLFTLAVTGPGGNYDVWVIATSSGEKNRTGGPLIGKGYLVVTIPE